jgi:hypothetical protein
VDGLLVSRVVQEGLEVGFEFRAGGLVDVEHVAGLVVGEAEVGAGVAAKQPK